MPAQRLWRKLYRPIFIATALALSGCDQLSSKGGVGEVLGLRFGVPLELKVKVGPRDPPLFGAHLREFYEVDFPNMEFEFVGVAVTKNDDHARKDGVFFNKEKLIWGAFFHNKTPCDEKEYLRTMAYLQKNWKFKHVNETKSKPNEGFFWQANLVSEGVFWDLSCGSGLGKTMTVSDFSVLRMAGDDNSKKVVDKVLGDVDARLKRKM